MWGPEGLHMGLQGVVIALACYGLVVALGGLLQRLGQGRGRKPYVSILVITHNDEERIEGIIRWLLNLNYSDHKGVPGYQVVVADNNSRDETLAILERLARENPSLKIAACREGESAYELGLSYCDGEVICLLDLKKKPAPRTVGQFVTGLLG